MSKWSAIWFTDIASSRTSCRIARRCGSARARSTESVDIAHIIAEARPLYKQHLAQVTACIYAFWQTTPEEMAVPTFLEEHRHQRHAGPGLGGWLGDLSTVGQWIPGVTAVSIDGMQRVCTFTDGHVQREQISDYSPTARSYHYRIEGAPLP
jgi:hypothetical protein